MQQAEPIPPLPPITTATGLGERDVKNRLKGYYTTLDHVEKRKKYIHLRVYEMVENVKLLVARKNIFEAGVNQNP